MMSLKKCLICGIEKPIDEFYLRKGAEDGHRNDCKACISSKSHQYYQSNKEKVIKKVQAYYFENKEAKIEYAHNHYKTNKEEILKKHAAYGRDHKKAIAEKKAVKYQLTKGEREEFRLANPKVYWANRTAGHHKLTGRKIRDEILKMAEETIFCPICNVKLKYGGGEKVSWHSASLDRKYNDDSKNIKDFWIICRHCNMTKLIRTLEEMDEWCIQWQEARLKENGKCD
jgi:hypothetical protein